MPTTVESILREIGPRLASDVKRILMEAGDSDAAARKKMSRARGDVRRLQGINLPRRESFLYVADHFKHGEWKDALIDAMISTGSAYGRALQGLRTRHGATPTRHFPVASGLPTRPARKHLQHSTVESKLAELELIQYHTSAEPHVVSLWDAEETVARRRAVLVAEGVLLAALKRWLVNLGFSSGGTLKTRDEVNDGQPMFGQFRWDIVGPSYLFGIADREQQGVQNGFIVGDIVLNKAISLDDLAPFFAKWDALRAQRRRTRFQPMYIASYIEDDALQQLRSHGALVGIPRVLFGEELEEQLKQLVAVVEHTAAAVYNDPDGTFALIDKLAKIEGAALNLRGILLEMIVGHLFNHDGYTIDIRQLIRKEGQVVAEIDVKANNRVEVVCCECKGNAPGKPVTKPEIEHWVKERLPDIKKWLNGSRALPQAKRFEFIASTGYDSDARAYAATIEAGHRKQPVEFLDGSAVLDRLKARNLRSLIQVFREQFGV